MHTALVESWGTTPKYTTRDLPPPTETQVRIKILAAGVHTVVRSRAAGKHFSAKNPPHIPGVDGVGTVVKTGELVYFTCMFEPTGSLAEEINVEKKSVVPLAKDADPDTIAVLANPAMSSWMALTARAGIIPGSKFTVAIIGATGVSGQAAVQIAKGMGAIEIIAIGKPGAKLEKTKELGATATIAFAEELKETDFEAAGNVDIVLDYLWGDVTTVLLPGIVSKRKNPNQRLSWIEIGSLGGEDAAIPASFLRKANIAIMGCAPGSWNFKELNEQLPTMLKGISENGMKAEFVIKGLKDVESWWGETGGPRILVKP
ncbi:GroES-like protein [Melanomma pulvis-pyrius CBS 109.77]|uniref:GroES-like protein n=1 Tax=Melanomma pulvis-pyrius CBS 109.77 TaxID=1314802 RepID=A0A6A6XT05_9PLEO|nr:GroES-like protein [Melanomma pulvis-pyrius CBS 109.77]